VSFTHKEIEKYQERKYVSNGTDALYCPIYGPE